MLSFINDFQGVLSEGISSLDDTLPLPPALADRLVFNDGQEYILTLADSLALADRTMVEIVRVSDGCAIQRGQEGTIAQDWPAGTPVMCAITAGTLTDILSRLEALESSPPPPPPPPPGELLSFIAETYIEEWEESTETISEYRAAARDGPAITLGEYSGTLKLFMASKRTPKISGADSPDKMRIEFYVETGGYLDATGFSVEVQIAGHPSVTISSFESYSEGDGFAVVWGETSLPMGTLPDAYVAGGSMELYGNVTGVLIPDLD